MSDNTTGSRDRSRTQRILDPTFVEGLEDLPIEEVRRRRDEALSEREFQSYLRRLVQVRQDLFAGEHRRRESGGPPQPLVDRITEVLSEGPKGSSRGEALRVVLAESDTEEADRRASELLGQVATADPQDLSEEQLAEALEVLARGERAVSSDRRTVLGVHDRFQDELKRRYRDDPTLALR